MTNMGSSYRSNQSEAFTYLPVIYGLGGITGPAVGGLLVFKNNPFRPGQANPFPYLAPNLFAAFVLVIDLVLTAFFLEESLEEAKDLPPLKDRAGNLFTWMWQFVGGSRNPTYARRQLHHNSRHRVDGADTDDETDNESESQSLLSLPGFLNTDSTLARKDVFKRDTIILLSTYLVFQLSNISYNTLYPVFAAGGEPTGRNLSPEVIGVSLAFAGVVAMVFQVALFGKLKDKMGNKATYRAGLFFLFFSMILMPWVGHKKDQPFFGIGSGTIWLWIELGVVLLIKTVASVGGLTSALLLVCLIFLTNSCYKQANKHRSPTQHRTTLFLARSTDSRKRSQQPVERLDPSYRVASSRSASSCSRKVRRWHGACLAVLRSWGSWQVLASEVKAWRAPGGMRRTVLPVRRVTMRMTMTTGMRTKRGPGWACEVGVHCTMCIGVWDFGIKAFGKW